ncbi:pyrroloquinoline quinone-dependent dehydrogenase [Mangrovimicrobium sediminis]|uniref:Pyrroloquinoline quinone-dependent dehydrogenase n=1 Tax=Mangrovimicrobium sediminis TaxID=2562682 RepID=A0A4Z0LZT5_9GAMM|nr:pyrroloquinoline quinone-dependent dehydrogenase [Haliea sp. SAOS-164]TGD72565.1 pyrroloquinoline quinone-dependent dehydrogenase [Haliea sp. SAOS-164]
MPRLATWIFTALFAALGIAHAIGGTQLLLAGGSGYFLLAGVLLLGTALALGLGRGAAVSLYGLYLLLTLGWSWWEVGLDGWALAPRLLQPAVLGLLFTALPFSALRGRPWRGTVTLPALACCALVAIAGIAAVLPDTRPLYKIPPEQVAEAASEWRNWGNTPGGTRFVASNQINTVNVDQLELAWRYDSDLPLPLYPNFEVTPLMADGRLYACLKAGVVVALEAESGREVWRYTTPDLDSFDFTAVFGAKCRGVSFYESPQPQAQCGQRVIFASPDGRLRAVDAATGEACAGFGKNGAVDLHAGMARQLPESRRKVAAIPSSPPAIIDGVIVVGQTVSDLASLDAPSGVVRGYDAETGALRWAWNAAQAEGEDPDDAYARATPNAWGPISGDPDLGLVFVPLGNSPPDYYGGQRPESLDRFTTAIIALDAASGRLRWSFQTVHHDLWDYDLAAQPVAVDLPGEYGKVPALLVPTKLAEIFVLDRRTGRPIDPVIEQPVPQGGVPGERTAPTQPQTTGFPSLAGPKLREEDMWGMTPLDQLWCRLRFRQANYEGPFTPVTEQDTIMFPGTAGGINWGSVSVDTERGLLVVNTLRFANFGRLIRREQAAAEKFGGKEGTAVFEQAGTPYIFAQSTFMSPLGVPCQRPPYGTIHGLDLASRRQVWSHSFGTSAKSGPFNIPTLLPIRMGVPNMGGSIITAGGVAFIGAAQDRKLRALDSASGRELWSYELPAIAAATPMSFVSASDGRQYVVIAAGGHYGIPGPSAAAILAFALPRAE